MPNFLETLAAERYEFGGYFVRRNVKVGKRPNGGYECELGIVAFHPHQKTLVHIEPTMDIDSWAKREGRYRAKFAAGRKYIPELFAGLEIPDQPEQIALPGYGSTLTFKTLGGGRIVLISDFMEEIRGVIRPRKLENAAVPEGFPILRALQYASVYWR